MVIEREKIRAALEKKGFKRKNTDHDYYSLFVNGKKQNVYTKLSRAPKYKDYGDELLAQVSRQLGLTKKELADFVDCFLEHGPYVELLKQRSRIR